MRGISRRQQGGDGGTLGRREAVQVLGERPSTPVAGHFSVPIAFSNPGFSDVRPAFPSEHHGATMTDKLRVQFAALPFRIREGEPEVMLITSRGTGRWIIPKGWPARRFAPAVAAAREAYEEAGLIGAVSKRPIGQYLYDKRTNGDAVRCRVEVFLLEVERELSEWPEQRDRGRRWLSPRQAALCVDETGLQDLFRGLDRRLEGRRGHRRGALGAGGRTVIDLGRDGKPKVRARRRKSVGKG